LRLIRKTGDFDPSLVRNGIRSVCGAAVARRIPPERVIIEIKELWASLPFSAGLSRAAGGVLLLSQVVTMVLDEYHANSPT